MSSRQFSTENYWLVCLRRKRSGCDLDLWPCDLKI